MCVLILDVCHFIGHLALQQQVTQVSLLQKPSIKVTKGALAVSQRQRLIWQSSKQLWKMARPSDKFHFAQKVCFALVKGASVAAGEVQHLLLVIFAKKLTDDLLGDVSADVFIIVALALHLFFLYLLENSQSPLLPLPLFLTLTRRTRHDDGGSDAMHGFPNEPSIAVGYFIGMGQKFTNKGVC